MLVDYWTGNARIADRCRQRGVAMLERPHSTPYIEQQLSFLRVYADTWIGKPGMVHPLADYVDDPARFKRSYAAKEDRSWEGNAVEFKRVVETVAAIDPRVAAQLALLLAFGLRRKEAVMFMPHSAVVPSRRACRPLSTHRTAMRLSSESSAAPRVAACALWPSATMTSARRSTSLCNSLCTRHRIWDIQAYR